MTRWPLPDWLALSVKVLGLSPETFWAMSLWDFAALIAVQNPAGIERETLANLMTNFPDKDPEL